MNALLKPFDTLSNHYWMLWISPTSEQIKQIKRLPLEERQRVLMLHPKRSEQLCAALELAISSGYYHSITLNREIIPSNQQQTLELLAWRNQTHINWISHRQNMNSACQLTLI